MPAEARFHFPGGLADFLRETLGTKPMITSDIFAGRSKKDTGHGRVEWAVAWTPAGFGEADNLIRSYCNTVPTANGGTHEAGLRAALTKGLRAYADISGMSKKAANITTDECHEPILVRSALSLLAILNFKAKPKTACPIPRRASWSRALCVTHLTTGSRVHPKTQRNCSNGHIQNSEDRLKRRKARDVKRKSATKKLRLPGKLSDCSRKGSEGTELFIVEGDSAGGSAKQARNRETQAILPLKGKILNVESATMEKIQRNNEISDLCTALGVGLGKKFELDDLRYERVVIMTDADVDGAHIAALLITFFYRYTPGLINAGRLYMAMPPLYKLKQGGKIAYAIDDGHKEELLATEFNGRGKIEIGRFKGLGEMMASQLKDTTMNPKTRKMIRITIDDDNLPSTEALVETLMGKRADLRFQYIQDHAQFIDDLDV